MGFNMKLYVTIVISMGFVTTPYCSPTYAHGPGPGMVVTCSGSTDGRGGGASVTNAATGKVGTAEIPSFAGGAGICSAVLLAAANAGVRAALENISAVAVYGAGTVVSVSGSNAQTSNANF
jgi:hypothetical protein